MFGIWLNEKIYENLPPAFFISGTLFLCLCTLPADQFAATLTAVSGIALIATAFHVVAARNKNRNKTFHFGQLILPGGNESPAREPKRRQTELEKAFGPAEMQVRQGLNRLN